MERIFATWINNIIQLRNCSTAPYLLSNSSHSPQRDDESEQHTLILAENEHFYTSYNPETNQRETNEAAYDFMQDLHPQFADYLLNALNSQRDERTNDAALKSAPHEFTELINTGLIKLYKNLYNDSLLIQVTDNHIYITLTYSGQY